MQALTGKTLRAYRSAYESAFGEEPDYDYDLYRYVSTFYAGGCMSRAELEGLFREWEAPRNFINKERMFLETFNSWISKSCPDVTFTTPDEVWKELTDYARTTFVGGDDYKSLMEFLCTSHKVEARNLPSVEDIGTAYVLANRDYGIVFAGLINRMKSGNPMSRDEIESGYNLDCSDLFSYTEELELPSIICKARVPKEKRNYSCSDGARPRTKVKPPFTALEIHFLWREFMELYSYHSLSALREKECQLKFINWLLEKYYIPPITSLPDRDEFEGIEVRKCEVDYKISQDYYNSMWERYLAHYGWRYFISPSDEHRIGNIIKKTRKSYWFNGSEIDESTYNSIKNPYSELTNKNFCAKVVSELFDKNYNKQEESGNSKPPVPFPEELF